MMSELFFMEQLLKQFGFSDQEIVVYASLLRSGGAKVSEIAKATGLKRTSCQEYVISLEEKGFINASKLGNKYFYQAEDPDKFRQIIYERLFTLDGLLAKLKNKKEQDLWEVKIVTLEEKRLALKRAKKKQKSVVLFGNDQNGGAIIANEKVFLHSVDHTIPALEISSTALAGFHRQIFGAVE